MAESIDRIIEVFEFFEDWESRYNYMAELGQKLPELPDTYKTPDNQVQGCVSKVWITVEADSSAPPRLTFRGDSDTPIIKGIVAILLAMYSGKSADEALSIDPDAIFNRLGIYEHLSPNRHVGVYSMVEKFRALACTVAHQAA